MHRFENQTRGLPHPRVMKKLIRVLRALASKRDGHALRISSARELRSVRRAVALSAHTLAHRAGIHVSIIHRVEAGLHWLRPRTLRALERVLTEARNGRIKSNPQGRRLYAQGKARTNDHVALASAAPGRRSGRGGRKASERSAEVRAYCYQGLKAGKKGAIIAREVNDLYDRTMKAKHVWTEAERHATKKREPWPIPQNSP